MIARAPIATRTGAHGGIVVAIAGGNLSALGTLFDLYGADVWRFLHRIGIARADLDDLVQETFLDVMRASGRYRPDAPVRPWLFGIAAMVARRHRRVVSRMLARLERWTTEHVEPNEPFATQDAETSLEAERAQRALEALSARKREAFVLVVLEGLSGDEAATALGIPVATVWTRLHHARRELRAALGEES